MNLFLGTFENSFLIGSSKSRRQWATQVIISVYSVMCPRYMVEMEIFAL